MIRKSRQVSLLSFIVLIAFLLPACAPPTAKITVSRNEIKAGDPVTVRWETKNAKLIQLNGETVQKIGSKTVTPKETTNYQILARRGKKEVLDRATVKVEVAKPPAPTAALRAEPDAIERGQSTILKWATENAKAIAIEGLGEVPASGEREVSPRVSTTYTLTGLGDGGSATASARVTVTDPPPPVADRPRTSKPEEPAIAELFKNTVKIIFFDLDASDLNPPEQEKLRRAADWLNRDRNRTIAFRVEGNCDPRGTAEYNLGLGDRRARAVRDFLVRLGVDASRIETISFGLEKAQGTDEGSTQAPPSWAFDRRADFTYLRGGERP
jgi:peptidoglycan-associated lipoprotein